MTTRTAEIDSPDSDTASVEPFSFTGTSAEYFRIWIVNVALTILTLGVYSAWAKVRTEQYFYGHTWVMGNNFAYHGNPNAILKGRLIFLSILVIPMLLLGLGADIVFVVVMGVVSWYVIFPWLLMRGLKFRAVNSSYRNVRFGFYGTAPEAFKYHFLGPVFALITLSLGYPWVAYKQRSWWVREHRFGTLSFTPRFSAGDFYWIYLAFVGIAFLSSTAVGILLATSAEDQSTSLEAQILQYVLIVFFVAFLRAKIMNLVYSRSSLGQLQLESTLAVRWLFWIYATNLVLIVLSLGLMTPWARVRLAAYRAGSLSLTNAEDLESIVAALPEGVDATGEAMSELFDFDIGI